MCSDEGSGRPGRRGVTLNAICSKYTHVEGRLHMAGSTIGWDPEPPGRVTLGALHGGMCTCQREGGEIMIKRDIVPACRYMTDGTVCAKLTIMAVVFRVARKTILWSAFENIIPMTRKTIHNRMFANQRKCRCIVIEFSARPFRGLMTCGAISEDDGRDVFRERRVVGCLGRGRCRRPAPAESGYGDRQTHDRFEATPSAVISCDHRALRGVFDAGQACQEPAMSNTTSRMIDFPETLSVTVIARR